MGRQSAGLWFDDRLGLDGRFWFDDRLGLHGRFRLDDRIGFGQRLGDRVGLEGRDGLGHDVGLRNRLRKLFRLWLPRQWRLAHRGADVVQGRGDGGVVGCTRRDGLRMVVGWQGPRGVRA